MPAAVFTAALPLAFSSSAFRNQSAMRRWLERYFRLDQKCLALAVVVTWHGLQFSLAALCRLRLAIC